MRRDRGVRSRLTRRWTAALATVVLAGCGGASGNPVAAKPAPAPSTTQPPSTSATALSSPATSSAGASGIVITTAASDYGVILFDVKGQAIYLFDRERTPTAQCYDECAAAWPPVLTTGAARAAGAVRADLLATTRRADGREQVTYAGHPLYYYAHEGPRQVLCHDVVEYGGRWLVVTPAGQAAPA